MPLYLGVKAVIVKSFARIHCANLVNAGILPLVFKNTSDYDKVEQTDNLIIQDIKECLGSGKDIIVKDVTKNFEFPVTAILSERQKKIILAGGLLNYTKENQG